MWFIQTWPRRFEDWCRAVDGAWELAENSPILGGSSQFVNGIRMKRWDDFIWWQMSSGWIEGNSDTFKDTIGFFFYFFCSSAQRSCPGSAYQTTMRVHLLYFLAPAIPHLFLPQVRACTCRLRIVLGLLLTQLEKLLARSSCTTTNRQNQARTVQRMAGHFPRQPKSSPPLRMACRVPWWRKSAAPHWNEPWSHGAWADWRVQNGHEPWWKHMKTHRVKQRLTTDNYSQKYCRCSEWRCDPELVSEVLNCHRKFHVKHAHS